MASYFFYFLCTMGDVVLNQGGHHKLAGCLCWEEKKEDLESNSFVRILNLMEGEKSKSLRRL